MELAIKVYFLSNESMQKQLLASIAVVSLIFIINTIMLIIFFKDCVNGEVHCAYNRDKCWTRGACQGQYLETVSYFPIKSYIKSNHHNYD